MSRSTHQKQRDILLYLSVAGFEGAPVAWIEEAVNWEKGRPALQNLLRRMVRNGLLMQPRYGHYTVTPNWRELGPETFGAVENAVAAELKRQGGAATTVDLFKAAFPGCDRFNDNERPYEHGIFHKVLRESDWFERIADGYWRLRPEADDPWHTVPPGFKRFHCV